MVYTYETFRDMGAAFMAALLLIYALIVWEFRNFTLGGLIMAPIPLTLIGIIPGHLIIGAEFTATSMIGFIALAGIIVRNSILLVEFVKHEVENGKDIVDAVITAGQIRMRPILITAGTLMVGAAMLFSDPIFIGMAASLFFGTLVATVLTLVVIPLGCISTQKQFYILAGVDMHETTCRTGSEQSGEAEKTTSSVPVWLTVWQKLTGWGTWAFYILRMFYIMAKMALDKFLRRFKSADRHDTPPDDTPPAGPGNDTPPQAPQGGSPSALQGVSDNITAAQNGGVNSASKAATGKPQTGAKKTPAKKTVAKKVARKKTASKKTAERTSARKKTAGKKRRGIKLKNI